MRQKENHPNWKGGKKNSLRLSKEYRARKCGAKGSHTQDEWDALKEKYDFKCLCCKLKEPFVNQKYEFLTEDHIVPLDRGGSNRINNIQPLCKSCNCRKHTKIINYKNI